MFAAICAFYRQVKAPTLKRLLVAGIATGLALAKSVESEFQLGWIAALENKLARSETREPSAN